MKQENQYWKEIKVDSFGQAVFITETNIFHRATLKLRLEVLI